MNFKISWLLKVIGETRKMDFQFNMEQSRILERVMMIMEDVEKIPKTSWGQNTGRMLVKLEQINMYMKSLSDEPIKDQDDYLLRFGYIKKIDDNCDWLIATMKTFGYERIF